MKTIIWIIVLAITTWVVTFKFKCFIIIVPFVNLLVDFCIEFFSPFLIIDTNSENLLSQGVEFIYIVWLPLR